MRLEARRLVKPVTVVTRSEMIHVQIDIDIREEDMKFEK